MLHNLWQGWPEKLTEAWSITDKQCSMDKTHTCMVSKLLVEGKTLTPVHQQRPPQQHSRCRVRPRTMHRTLASQDTGQHLQAAGRRYEPHAHTLQVLLECCVLSSHACASPCTPLCGGC